MTKKGVRNMKQFIKYIEKMKKTKAVWNVDQIYGVTTEEIEKKMNERTAKEGSIGWDQVAIMLKEEFDMTEFQVAFVIGSLFTSRAIIRMAKTQMDLQKVPRFGQ